MNTKKKINKASGEYRFRRIPREKSANSSRNLNFHTENRIRRISKPRHRYPTDRISQVVSFGSKRVNFFRWIVSAVFKINRLFERKNVSGSLEKLKPSSVL
jgi:hypothetical protein